MYTNIGQKGSDSRPSAAQRLDVAGFALQSLPRLTRDSRRRAGLRRAGLLDSRPAIHVAYASKVEATKVDALMASARFPIPQGTLDMLVLHVLSLEAAHGYAIAQRVQLISREALRV